MASGSSLTDVANGCPALRRRWSRPALALLVFAVAVTGTNPGGAQARIAEPDPAPSVEFAGAVAALFDRPLPAVADTSEPPRITGDGAADARIRELAEARGYRRRGEPLDPLGSVQGQPLQARAVADFEAMDAALRAETGVGLTVTSGQRSVSLQRELFVARLRSLAVAERGRPLTASEIALGVGDEIVDLALRTVAVPGYSKHHTGYALDVASGPYYRFDLPRSAAWGWLVADDYENPMRFGWVPSYPDGVSGLGPDPEPWEWVWIGRPLAQCARDGACPLGGIDRVDPEPGGRIEGWALDALGSPGERFRVEAAVASGTVVTELERPARFDVAVAMGLSDPRVGFSLVSELAAGTRWVCVESSSAGLSMVRIGCAEVDPAR